MKLSILLILLSSLILIACMPSKRESIIQKNKCYEDKLTALKADSLYNTVMNDFTFSFNILRPSYKELDQAVFFKHDSTSCLLIVLEKSDVMFGHARMIRGQSINGRWIFSESLRYSFAEDYYNLYKENTFENISKLARYSVMTDGDYKKKGCEIDEYFWFTYLEE